MTGRYAIRTGNHTVALAGGSSGLVAWERTMGDAFSGAGYATMCMGKWHVGDRDGSWPTDHGFDEWYGPPHSYDEALWETDPWYRPGRDPVSYMYEGRKGKKVTPAGKLTYDVKRNADVEYTDRSLRFIEANAQAGRPFFLYFNHTLMHIPVVPRDEYKGRSGNGDWADCLLQLDGDFGVLLDKLDALGIADDTIVVFAGDNGNEEALLHRGTAGFFEGSVLHRHGGIAANAVHRPLAGTDRLGERRATKSSTSPTGSRRCCRWPASQVPDDRVIDGKDQTAFLGGGQESSSRDGFIYWNGATMYGVKWRNFKLALVKQKYFLDPAEHLAAPYVINLMTDPKEREAMNQQYFHSWTMAHFGRLLGEFRQSVEREPLIPAGAPLDFVPKATKRT
jgi:arylsulfatase